MHLDVLNLLIGDAGRQPSTIRRPPLPPLFATSGPPGAESLHLHSFITLTIFANGYGG